MLRVFRRQRRSCWVWTAKEIKDDIDDQLKREDFSKGLPGTQIAYAAGNPQPANPSNLEYIHVVKFVGL